MQIAEMPSLMVWYLEVQNRHAPLTYKTAGLWLHKSHWLQLPGKMQWTTKHKPMFCVHNIAATDELLNLWIYQGMPQYTNVFF